jgi:hypothetical protein
MENIVFWNIRILLQTRIYMELNMILSCCVVFLNILIDVYTSLLLSNIGLETRCEPPLNFGENFDTNVILWHYKTL